MTTKNFFGIIAISFVFLVLLSGCSQQAPPASTPTPNPSTQTPEQPVETPAETPVVTATPAETPAATPTPAVELTYAVADCSIISLADIKTVCKRGNATSEPATVSIGKLCAVLFKNGESTLTLEGTDAKTADAAASGVKGCQSFGKAVGDTGCQMDRAAVVAKDKYLVGIDSYNPGEIADWLCSTEQVTELIQLIQSR